MMNSHYWVALLMKLGNNISIFFDLPEKIKLYETPPCSKTIHMLSKISLCAVIKIVPLFILFKKIYSTDD